MKRCAVGTQWAGAGPCVCRLQTAFGRKKLQIGVRTAHCALRKSRVRTQWVVCQRAHTTTECLVARVRVLRGCSVGTQWVLSGTQSAECHRDLGLKGNLRDGRKAPAAVQFCEIQSAYTCATGMREISSETTVPGLTFAVCTRGAASMHSKAIKTTANNSYPIINYRVIEASAEASIPAKLPTLAAAAHQQERTTS